MVTFKTLVEIKKNNILEFSFEIKNVFFLLKGRGSAKPCEIRLIDNSLTKYRDKNSGNLIYLNNYL